MPITMSSTDRASFVAQKQIAISTMNMNRPSGFSRAEDQQQSTTNSSTKVSISQAGQSAANAVNNSASASPAAAPTAGDAIFKITESARSKPRAALDDAKVKFNEGVEKVNQDYGDTISSLSNERDSDKALVGRLAASEKRINEFRQLDLNVNNAEQAFNDTWGKIENVKTPDTAISTIRDTDFSAPAQSRQMSQRANIYAANAQPQQPVLSLLA